MGESSKSRGVINEDNFYDLLQRYTPTAILTVLNELAQLTSEVKFDWKKITEKSTSGISNPREYRMLWKHLAYGKEIRTVIDESAPLGDDESDLEYDLDSVPAASEEVKSKVAEWVKDGDESFFEYYLDSVPAASDDIKSEVAEYLKVLMQPASETHALQTFNGHGFKSDHPDKESDNFDNGKNGICQTNKKRRHEKNEGRISKKKHKWTPIEDDDLEKAVAKFGERNWSEIPKEYFKHDKNTAQMAQRWNILKKKHAPKSTGNSISSNKSTELEATKHAFNMALGPLRSKNLSAKNTEQLSVEKDPQVPTVQLAQILPQESVNKARTCLKSGVAIGKADIDDTNYLIKQAAIAAGARIVHSSDIAAPLLTTHRSLFPSKVGAAPHSVLKTSSTTAWTPDRNQLNAKPQTLRISVSKDGGEVQG